ncbi:MAG: SpoIIE family protein phosphatase [Actinomycetota bacterium]|nr:SpoIIE family protein phosphatase [Actinomycetota bacterium]
MDEVDGERLRNLLSVTDTALSGLDLDELLVEVLDRVREILDADTAAVLLAEPGSNDLVARAACGLEEEVRQGVRVPIGAGFAGSIASRRQPVVLDRVDSSTVANPILWEKGIKTMLGVPLVRRDELLGVIHVGRLDVRRFTPADVEVLVHAAEPIAASIYAQRLAAESAAARLLERGLLPTHLPQVPNLTFSARYVPAEHRGVGGDWYDAFTVPSGQLWLISGDVAGHGLAAAVVMGRIKSALRAYALDNHEPHRVLELTDRKVQHFEIGTMVTVVCATAKPPYDTFEISLAGHLPPVLASRDQPTRLVDVEVQPPLGVAPGLRRTSTSVDFPPGAVLLLYTDGLVERRGQDIASRLQVLRAAVSPNAAEIVCRDVMHELVGNCEVADDIALLAVRRAAPLDVGPPARPTGSQDW